MLHLLALAIAIPQTEDKAPPPAEPEKKGALPAAVGKAAEGAPKQGEAAPPEERRSRRPAAPPATFEEGLGDFYSDDFVGAAAAMFDYVATNEPTADNFEWGEFFLGVSLRRLGFEHAAAEYLFNVASNRTHPEILPDALIELEALMAGPHDEELLDRRLLVDNEFGYLPPYVADFVTYTKGLFDLRAGRVQWAERLFGRIPDDSKYYPKARFALSVQRLRRSRMSDAVKGFRVVLDHPLSDRDLRNEARLALARVLYEKERYKAARKVYEQVEVPELTVAEASLYLEKAWASYWLRDYRRTMGILYALEAPSYREYFAPEKYLLRALVYKNLCHYIPAKREIRRFRFRFDETLENIRSRIDLREDERLRTAALQRGELGRLADFRRLLAREAEQIETIGGRWIEVELEAHLETIYELKAKQVDLGIDAMLRKEARRVGEELVEFEEQMYLLDYEIGLEIYRRLKKEDARRPTEADNLEIPAEGKLAYFEFVDEFWNDELPKYQFYVENRCFDEGGED
jgi:TolA-binding protein